MLHDDNGHATIDVTVETNDVTLTNSDRKPMQPLTCGPTTKTMLSSFVPRRCQTLSGMFTALSSKVRR